MTNMPPVNVWVDKPWGKTKLLFRDDRSGTHIIDINPHGYCSAHYHKNLSNAFYVVSGALEIVVWNWDGTDKNHLLEPHEYLKVPPGVWHRFINHDVQTVCLELYETPEHTSNDIVRADEGGSNGYKFGLDKLRQNPTHNYTEPVFFGRYYDGQSKENL
jgi:mannose-6-phosphate isomerase-like protein (cupin superfamily)